MINTFWLKFPPHLKSILRPTTPSLERNFIDDGRLSRHNKRWTFRCGLAWSENWLVSRWPQTANRWSRCPSRRSLCRRCWFLIRLNPKYTESWWMGGWRVIRWMRWNGWRPATELKLMMLNWRRVDFVLLGVIRLRWGYRGDWVGAAHAMRCSSIISVVRTSVVVAQYPSVPSIQHRISYGRRWDFEERVAFGE